MTKNNGLIGVRSMRISHPVGEITNIELELLAYPGYDANHLYNENWDELFPGNSIVKCSHCGQWAARKTECKHCGAPV